MLPTSPGLLAVLRLGLGVAAFGWGISFYFLCTPWSGAELWLRQMGADPIAYQPLLHYWLRMAAAVFGCVGIGAAWAAFRPARLFGFIVFLAGMHVVVGTVLAVTAVQNGLTPKEHPTFIFDTTFCFTVAILVGVPLLQGWRTRPRAG